MSSDLWQAEFIDTATTPASTLRVKIPGFDNGVGSFVVAWSPLGNALPASGDQALVAESDEGTWWAVTWESASQATVDAVGLDARLDVIEARPVVHRGTLTLNWLTGQNSSQNTTGVAHGFAVAPAVVFVEPITTGLPTIAFAQAFSIGATTFSAAGYVPTAPGSGVAITAAWTAIS